MVRGPKSRTLPIQLRRCCGWRGADEGAGRLCERRGVEGRAIGRGDARGRGRGRAGRSGDASRLRLPGTRRLGGRAQDRRPRAARQLRVHLPHPRRGPDREPRVQARGRERRQRVVVAAARLFVPARVDHAAGPEASGLVRLGACRRRRAQAGGVDRDRGHRGLRRARLGVDLRLRADAAPARPSLRRHPGRKRVVLASRLRAGAGALGSERRLAQRPRRGGRRLAAARLRRAPRARRPRDRVEPERPRVRGAHLGRRCGMGDRVAEEGGPRQPLVRAAPRGGVPLRSGPRLRRRARRRRRREADGRAAGVRRDSERVHRLGRGGLAAWAVPARFPGRDDVVDASRGPRPEPALRPAGRGRRIRARAADVHGRAVRLARWQARHLGGRRERSGARRRRPPAPVSNVVPPVVRP